MRELVAFSKLINLSDRERAKFQAALMDKKIEFSEAANSDALPQVQERIRELEKRALERNGFKS